MKKRKRKRRRRRRRKSQSQNVRESQWGVAAETEIDSLNA